ncbi:MAG: VCBS repeat-containing protein, partial [Chlorobi bacterium]|nr:VCBS repeat-containing protein [Chlorobiota bacterium]
PIFYDIDGDGLLDLLISGMIDGDDKIFHYEQTSSGAITFTKLSEHFVTPDDGRNSFSFADVDGDGLLDLFVGKYNGTISRYEQDAVNSYSFSLITNKFSDIDIGYNCNPTITDFFNDGILDLVIGMSSSDNLIYY